MNPQQPLTVARARAIDRDAAERLHMPTLLLMENAARGVADAAKALGDRFVLFCGPGNNGGDGLAAARHLNYSRCRIHLLAEPDPVRSPDAALQARILRAAGAEIIVGRLPDPAAMSSGNQVWIDALFGTGLTRALEGDALRWVQAWNAGVGAKLSVDIPSGLHGDTGEVLGAACRADVTVTFVAPKVGMTTPAARAYCGRVVVVGLGLP